MKCAALGCQTASSKKGGMVFCYPHWRDLPEELRGPTALKAAAVYLAKKDGYLVDEKVVRASTPREDGNPRDYV